ncbi:MAG: hypothetical protein HQL06_13800 [Nitrospirae bacterium]|nr:hypothetical protein [Nitrospirota bacterium]
MNVNSAFNSLQQTANVYQSKNVSSVNRVGNTTEAAAKGNAARGQDKVTISAEARAKYEESLRTKAAADNKDAAAKTELSRLNTDKKVNSAAKNAKTEEVEKTQRGYENNSTANTVAPATTDRKGGYSSEPGTATGTRG